MKLKRSRKLAAAAAATELEATNALQAQSSLSSSNSSPSGYPSSTSSHRYGYSSSSGSRSVSGPPMIRVSPFSHPTFEPPMGSSNAYSDGNARLPRNGAAVMQAASVMPAGCSAIPGLALCWEPRFDAVTDAPDIIVRASYASRYQGSTYANRAFVQGQLAIKQRDIRRLRENYNIPSTRAFKCTHRK
jgi:hypothetical protein